MGLLDTIRSLLGLGGNGTDRDRAGGDRVTDVRIEHDPDEAAAPETMSESAVKGTDDSPEHDDEPVATGTDATASTESLVEEPDEPEAAAEPAEAAGPTAEEPDIDAASEPEVTEPADETADEPDPDEEDDTGAGDDSVEVLSGIGQAYGKRLADAGVETVAELAAADAAELADSSGISEKRIAGWKASAEARLE